MLAILWLLCAFFVVLSAVDMAYSWRTAQYNSSATLYTKSLKKLKVLRFFTYLVYGCMAWTSAKLYSSALEACALGEIELSFALTLFIAMALCLVVQWKLLAILWRADFSELRQSIKVNSFENTLWWYAGFLFLLWLGYILAIVLKPAVLALG